MAAGREDIVEAAFRLFAVRGYDATAVDEIAAEAGVSRSTFFRSFGSKEAVIFPDHDGLLRRVEERLGASHANSALAAVVDAVKLVLFHYVAEGKRARERYRLTSKIPTLRERELVSGARYQQLFRRHLTKWGDGSDGFELRAEITAAAVVAAHNHVLRRWLRGECSDPHAEIEQALALVHNTFVHEVEAPPIALLVVPEGVSMGMIASAVRQAVDEPPAGGSSPSRRSERFPDDRGTSSESRA
jgi:AcrR family transcriptional regulator